MPCKYRYLPYLAESSAQGRKTLHDNYALIYFLDQRCATFFVGEPNNQLQTSSGAIDDTRA